MTEALRAFDYDDYSSEGETDADVATSFLENEAAVAQPAGEPAIEDSGPLIPTDWLAMLSPQPVGASEVDEPPPPEPRPAGMAQHLAPPRLRPTLGARISSGLGKSVLTVVFLVLIGTALLGVTYALLSTGWLASLRPATGLGPQPGAPAPIDPNGAPEEPAPQAQLPPGQSVGPGGQDFQQMRDQGVAELKAGHYDQAITLLQDAANVNQHDAVTEYQLGLAYLAVPDREHSADDAELAFRSAIALQADWAPPYRLLAESLLRRGLFAQAVEPAKKATDLDPSRAEAWLTLGRAYQGAGNAAEATKAFAQATRLSPAPPAAP